MSSIPQNHSDNKALVDCVQKFFFKHHVGKILAKCNGLKEKGVAPVSLLRYKLSNIFVGRSMYMQQRTGSFKEEFSKNTFYRFLNSTKTNWLRFTSLLAADIVENDIRDLTDETRKNVFIIDDSLFNRTSCKKTELGSKVFDHTDMHYKKGFRMLTLSWSDGNTLIPVNSCLLASTKEENIIGPVNNFDKRTLAGKRRKLAQTKAPEAMMTLLDTAVSAGLTAEYVLFDSWFSNPAQITAVKEKSMDVIAMIKKSSRIKYLYNDELLNIKEIYSRNKKRRGRSRYLLSVDVMVGKENPIPAKIVCVRNRANRKDWLAFICTDTQLSEEEIIRIYRKRWQIEVFFKTCKSMLNLIGECHSLSYDALTAHVAIVFTRYMLLATEQRQNEDQRILGELFYFLVDEMADITFNRSINILWDALMASLICFVFLFLLAVSVHTPYAKLQNQWLIYPSLNTLHDSIPHRLAYCPLLPPRREDFLHIHHNQLQQYTDHLPIKPKDYDPCISQARYNRNHLSYEPLPPHEIRVAFFHNDT